LLAVGNGEVKLGGHLTHFHKFAHTHRAVSGPSLESDRPLGLHNVGAAARHVHVIATQSQSPTTTGPASNLPPSRRLLAFIMSESLWHVRPGIIVAYTGKLIPEGWMLCDGTHGTPRLDGFYVMMRHAGQVGDTAGSSSHSHDTMHRHNWGVAQTNPQTGFGFYGDIFPAPHVDFSASPLEHAHSAWEENAALSQAAVVRAMPPSVSVRFIQAGPNAKEMPTGAVMPYTGSFIPLGWSPCRIAHDANLAGRLLFGTADRSSVLSTFGTEQHRHKIAVRHHVNLEAPLPPGTGVQRQQGPPIAIAAHRHGAEVDEEIISRPASHVPPYVSIQFIEKD
jgi:hypothetical protein